MIKELKTYCAACEKFIQAATTVVECNIILQIIDEVVIARFKYIIPEAQMSQCISHLHALVSYRLTTLTNHLRAEQNVKEQ